MKAGDSIIIDYIKAFACADLESESDLFEIRLSGEYVILRTPNSESVSLIDRWYYTLIDQEYNQYIVHCEWLEHS